LLDTFTPQSSKAHASTRILSFSEYKRLISFYDFGNKIVLESYYSDYHTHSKNYWIWWIPFLIFFKK